MKNKIIALLCVIVISLLALAACDDDKKSNEDCVHTFSDEWASSETDHWHPATCEHGEIKDSVGVHVDADEDGFCDVCKYESGHFHSFDGDWIIGEFKHWKLATCSHTDVKGAEALHSDDNMDGVCEICEGHVHRINTLGYCMHADCGKHVKEVDFSGIETIVNGAMLHTNRINGVSISYNFVGRSNSGSGSAKHSEAVELVFGADGYTYSKTRNKNSVLEGWYYPEGDGVFGVTSEDGGETFTLVAASEDNLKGYYYTVSTLADAHTAEDLLYNIYQLVSSPNAADLVIEIDSDNNKLGFSFNIMVINAIGTSSSMGGEESACDITTVYNVSYYELEIDVTHDDNYALVGLDIVCDCYTNDAGSSDEDGFDNSNVDFLYDSATNGITFVKYDSETDTYLPTSERTPDTYTFSITQTVGDRTAENPNPKSKFIPQDFDVFTNCDSETGELSNIVGSSISTEVGEVTNLYFGNYYPTGSSMHYAPELLEIKVYDSQGNELEGFGDFLVRHELINVCLTFGGQQRSVFVIPRTAGQYKIAFHYDGNLVSEIVINAQ